MPSIVINNQSGGQPLFTRSGSYAADNPWSGKLTPVGTLQVEAWSKNSGSLWVSLSGAPTITSAGLNTSGVSVSGDRDVVELPPGGTYSIPRLGMSSGVLGVRILGDDTCSGQGRLFLEAF